MGDLESVEKDAPRRVLWHQPMGWLSVIRPHRRDEAWSASLWQTFFAICVGAHILTTERLIRLLMTFFAQPTRLNLNRAVALTLIFMGTYITRMT